MPVFDPSKSEIATYSLSSIEDIVAFHFHFADLDFLVAVFGDFSRFLLFFHLTSILDSIDLEELLTDDLTISSSESDWDSDSDDVSFRRQRFLDFFLSSFLPFPIIYL